MLVVQFPFDKNIQVIQKFKCKDLFASVFQKIQLFLIGNIYKFKSDAAVVKSPIVESAFIFTVMLQNLTKKFVSCKKKA